MNPYGIPNWVGVGFLVFVGSLFASAFWVALGWR